MALYRTIAEYAVAVTPSDSADLQATSTIYIGVGGNAQVTTKGGDVVVFTGVVAGTILPVAVTRVWNTNTTATNMVACY